MSIQERKTIDIFNYNSFSVAVKTKDAEYVIEGTNDDIPKVLSLSPDEVKHIHSNSQAFKCGLLFFEDEIEQEVYEDFLRYNDWKNILRNEDIKEIIIHPTMEGLEKFISDENPSVFDRIRGIFINLKNRNEYDISHRVEELINRRYEEIQKKIYKTEIVLDKKDVVVPITISEVNALKSENEEIKNLMAQRDLEMQQMREMLERLNKQNMGGAEVNDNEKESDETSAQPRAGRPRK